MAVMLETYGEEWSVAFGEVRGAWALLGLGREAAVAADLLGVPRAEAVAAGRGAAARGAAGRHT